ncbi:MAG: YeeE/YedE thiosulfate transporter family protein [Polyangiaceae bacterium]
MTFDRASDPSSPANDPRPYADPYLAGFGLGIVLLAAFVLSGRGLGASGAFSSVAAKVASVIASERAAASPTLGRYLQSGGVEWLLVEVVGVMLGGFASAWFAGRLRFDVERGSRISTRGRLTFAVAGGVLMGIGAALARGCTSGLALSGGALLSVGSWLFTMTAFAGGYLAAPLFRRAWR